MVGSGTIAGMSAPADSAASTVDSGRRRLDSIDVLRALAILTMILVHFVENLSNDEHGYRFLWSLADTLGSFSAPIFTFLVGASFAISLDRHRRRGQTESEIAVRTMRRALLIFLAGLLFQVFIWLPGAVFDWDILTFIGASIVVLWAIRNRSTGTVLAAVVGIVTVSPLLRDWTGYATHWNSWVEYVHDFSAGDVAFGFLVHGYFPLFPWLVFPLLGMLAGRHIVTRGDAPFLLPGVVLVAVATAGVLLSGSVDGAPGWYVSAISFYPASTTFLAGTVGVILVLLWWLYGWLDAGDEPPARPWMVFFRRYSRYSLTVYVLHHMAHVWPLYAAVAWGGYRDIWRFYANAVSVPVAWLLAGVFIAVMYGVLTVWDRHGGKFSFEWALGKLVG